MPTTQPTPTTIDDEAAVRELHTYFMTEYFEFDTRETTFDERVAELETLAIEPQVQRSKDFLTEIYASGNYILSPGDASNIVSVQISGETARVVDCSQGRSELYSEDGELLVQADDFFKLRATEMRKIDGRWWIEDSISGGDQRCDPDDSL